MVAMIVLPLVLFLIVHASIEVGGRDIDNTALPAVPSSRRDSPLRVVIDPGHGGTDVGAVGASGRYEKDFTLKLARITASLLEQEPGIEVFMTRTDDRFISQTSRFRPTFANELDADLLISIHGNTYSDPRVTGTETYYFHRHSRTLANIVQRHVARATGFRNRGIKRENFFLLEEARMPAVLVEVGYLTNPDDEALMWTEQFQQRVAEAIVAAIKEYSQ